MYTIGYQNFIKNIQFLKEDWINEIQIPNYGHDIDNILLDKRILLCLSYDPIWSLEESQYIQNVINLNKAEFLNEGELKLLFFDYNEESLNEAIEVPPKVAPVGVIKPINSPHSLVTINHNNQNRPTKIILSHRIRQASMAVKDKVSNWLQKLAKKIKEYKNFISTSVVGSFTTYTEKSKKNNNMLAGVVYKKSKDDILDHDGITNKLHLKDQNTKNEQQVTWITKVYLFLKTEVFDKLLGALKETVNKIINVQVKESILNKELDLYHLLLEGELGKLQVHNVHKHILQLIGKVDIYIHQKFKFIFDAFAQISGFGIASIIKIMDKLGGPKAPEDVSLLSRSSTAFMRSRYTDLESKASRYLNPKVTIAALIKKTIKRASIIALPAMGIYYKIVSWINKIDIIRNIAQRAYNDEQKIIES